jgi:hypothetical protein
MDFRIWNKIFPKWELQGGCALILPLNLGLGSWQICYRRSGTSGGPEGIEKLRISACLCLRCRGQNPASLGEWLFLDIFLRTPVPGHRQISS